MTWRWVPPAVSPIELGSVLRGTAAALSLISANEARLVAQLQACFGGGTVVLADSGTSALVLALRAVATRMRTVALPAYACIDVTAAAARAGLAVRLYDVEPTSLSPDLTSLRAALLRGVDAVVVAPLFGFPVDYDAVLSLVSEHGVPVVEDAAQAAGGEFRDKPIGGYGDVTIFSFGRGKGITGGSGGAVIARGHPFDERLLEAAETVRLRRGGIRDAAGLAAQWLLARPSVYWLPASLPGLRLGEMVYRPAGEPRGVSAFAASVVPHALAGAPVAAAARRERARELERAALRGTSFSPVRSVHGGVPGYLRMPLLSRKAVAGTAPRLGVLRGYPTTLGDHPATAAVQAAGEPHTPGAVQLRDRLVTAPTHARCSRGDVDRLTHWLERGGP